MKDVVSLDKVREKGGLILYRGREIDLGHGVEGGDERVNLGRMNGSHHPFGIQISGLGVMAPDFTSFDRGNRGKAMEEV